MFVRSLFRPGVQSRAARRLRARLQHLMLGLIGLALISTVLLVDSPEHLALLPQAGVHAAQPGPYPPPG